MSVNCPFPKNEHFFFALHIASVYGLFPPPHGSLVFFFFTNPNLSWRRPNFLENLFSSYFFSFFFYSGRRPGLVWNQQKQSTWSVCPSTKTYSSINSKNCVKIWEIFPYFQSLFLEIPRKHIYR